MPNSIVFIRASHTFTGDPDKIAEQLGILGELLELEADSIARKLPSSPSPLSMNAIEYTAFLSDHAKLLAKILSNAEELFGRAASPHGSPEKLGRAFASVLTDFAAVRVALDDVVPPDSLRNSQATLHAFLASLYHQMAVWSKKVRSASESVTGDKLDLELSAAADFGPFERAFAAESKAL